MTLLTPSTLTAHRNPSFAPMKHENINNTEKEEAMALLETLHDSKIKTDETAAKIEKLESDTIAA
jgi:hypothetical protein